MPVIVAQYGHKDWHARDDLQTLIFMGVPMDNDKRLYEYQVTLVQTIHHSYASSNPSTVALCLVRRLTEWIAQFQVTNCQSLGIVRRPSVDEMEQRQCSSSVVVRSGRPENGTHIAET